MALTGQGGQFGGPQYGWGEVPNNPGAGVRSGGAGSRTNFNPGGGQYNASPEAGLRRGAWQWHGHGPSAQRDYGWDYQGGVGRDEITQRTEARGGGSYQARMAQDRGGGLPRYAGDYDAGDRWFPRPGQGGGDQDYDRGLRGGTGGSNSGRYDEGYRASGGGVGSGGNRYGRGDTGFRGDLAPAFGGQYGIGNEYADRYDRELRARDGVGFGSGGRYGAGQGYASDFGGGRGQMERGRYQQVTYGFGQARGGYGRDLGARQGGGYGRDFGARQGGGYGREFGGGRALGGGYAREYTARPLTDEEFYSRVNRW